MKCRSSRKGYVLIKFPVSDMKPKTKEKLSYIVDVVKMFDKKGQKKFYDKYDEILGEKMMEAFCSVAENISAEFGFVDDVFVEFPEPAAVCRARRALEGK